MIFVPFLAILSTKPKLSEEVLVRNLLTKMQQTKNPGYMGESLVPLDKKAAPILIRMLPKIQIPWVFEAVTIKLQSWNRTDSIGPLVESFDRDLSDPRYPHHAALPALGRWGWMATEQLLTHAKSGQYAERLRCMVALANQAGDRPEDPRISAFFLGASHSQSSEMRLTAARGLDQLSGHIFGWMESTHESTQDNDDAFERLVGLILDPEPEVSRFAFERVHYVLWSFLQNSVARELPRSGTWIPLGELPALKHNALTSHNPWVRAACLAILRKLQQDQAISASSLTDTAPMVRRTAAECLRGTLDQKLVPTVAETLKSPTDQFRATAAYVLGWSYLKEAIGPLSDALSDPSSTVRKLAREGLDRIQGKTFAAG